MSLEEVRDNCAPTHVAFWLFTCAFSLSRSLLVRSSSSRCCTRSGACSERDACLRRHDAFFPFLHSSARKRQACESCKRRFLLGTTTKRRRLLALPTGRGSRSFYGAARNYTETEYIGSLLPFLPSLLSLGVKTTRISKLAGSISSSSHASVYLAGFPDGPSTRTRHCDLYPSSGSDVPACVRALLVIRPFGTVISGDAVRGLARPRRAGASLSRADLSHRSRTPPRRARAMWYSATRTSFLSRRSARCIVPFHIYRILFFFFPSAFLRSTV